MTIKDLRIYFYMTAIGLGGVSTAQATLTPFTAADFSLIIQPERPTVQPGQLIIFDGILHNLSSQSATFGGNISLFGLSSSPEINGANLFSSPYLSSFSFPFSLSYQTIAPGGNLQFQFMTVGTLPSIPLGSVVTSGTGNFLFQDIPRSTSDPYVDFFIPMSLASVVVAVPEPGTFLLAGLSLAVLWFRFRPIACPK
jgi:PEP-CTERM motif